MPSVYLTSIYSLFDLANIQKGHVSDPCLQYLLGLCLTTQ